MNLTRAPTPHANCDEPSVLRHLPLFLARRSRASARRAGRGRRATAGLEAILVHLTATMEIEEATGIADATLDEGAAPDGVHGAAVWSYPRHIVTENLQCGMALALTSASKDECCACTPAASRRGVARRMRKPAMPMTVAISSKSTLRPAPTWTTLTGWRAERMGPATDAEQVHPRELQRGPRLSKVGMAASAGGSAASRPRPRLSRGIWCTKNSAAAQRDRLLLLCTVFVSMITLGSCSRRRARRTLAAGTATSCSATKRRPNGDAGVGDPLMSEGDALLAAEG